MCAGVPHPKAPSAPLLRNIWFHWFLLRDALGEELQVIWELEPAARAFDKMELPIPKGFDSPARLDAFLDAVRWGAAPRSPTRS